MFLKLEAPRLFLTIFDFRVFKCKAPWKTNHKTHRKPTNTTKMVPPQFVPTLQVMFSIVGWLAARDPLARRFGYLRDRLWALLEDWWPGILEAAGLAGIHWPEGFGCY